MIVVAFSTAENVRRRDGVSMHATTELASNALSPLFQAVAEASEEAIYNSLLRAEDVFGHKGTVAALPIDKVKVLLRR